MKEHVIGQNGSLTLATVVDNDDPDERGRVKIRLHQADVEIWAAVATRSAGNGYGVAMLPRVDEIVVATFIGPEFPLVIGSIWSGQAPMPEESGPAESRYSITSPAGLRMVMDDENGPRVKITTPGGQEVTITDEGGGAIHARTAGSEINMTSTNVEITAGAEVKVDAGVVTVNAGQVSVSAGMSTFSGVVQCDTLITNAVVSSSYTPGAGNIW